MAKCKNCTRLFEIQDEESDMFGEVWCDKICDNPDVEREHNCAYFKTMTNGDRIRKMTDEELAKERIDRIDMYTNSPAKEFIGDFCGIVNSEEEAIKKELEWLHEKVKE